MNSAATKIVQNKKSKPARKPLNSPFAKNLKMILESRQISQRAAAEIAGVSPTVIANWLVGQSPHDFLAVHRLAVGLGVSFEFLLTGEGSLVPVPSAAIEDLFEIHEAFEGIFRISAQRLTRKKTR